MPTQRPFLSNLLAAFRAQSRAQPLPKSSASISSTATSSAPATIWATGPQQVSKAGPSSPEANVSGPKPVNPKTSSYNPSSSTPAQDRQLVASLSPLQHSVSPQTHLPRSPPSPAVPIYAPQNYPSVRDVRRSRRGSDSSSEGYRETRGAGEKWFIGGLAATGEEKYYKLSMVKRDKSLDRISADQMSI